SRARRSCASRRTSRTAASTTQPTSRATAGCSCTRRASGEKALHGGGRLFVSVPQHRVAAGDDDDLEQLAEGAAVELGLAGADDLRQRADDEQGPQSQVLEGRWPLAPHPS